MASRISSRNDKVAPESPISMSRVPAVMPTNQCTWDKACRTRASAIRREPRRFNSLRRFNEWWGFDESRGRGVNVSRGVNELRGVDESRGGARVTMGRHQGLDENASHSTLALDCGTTSTLGRDSGTPGRCWLRVPVRSPLWRWLCSPSRSPSRAFWRRRS